MEEGKNESLGHVAELNVRQTRLASDEVNTKLVPQLAARIYRQIMHNIYTPQEISIYK